jgi:hypothetical protein
LEIGLRRADSEDVDHDGEHTEFGEEVEKGLDSEFAFLLSVGESVSVSRDILEREEKKSHFAWFL